MTYQYDLAGRVTKARYNGGNENVFAYDALGRMTQQGMYNSPTYYQYDTAGRKTRTSWADGNYVSYDYDATGNITNIRENDSAILGTYAYDNLGRKISLTRANGTVTNYTYDPVSRLSSFTQDLAGTAHDLTVNGIAYNPASQLLSVTRSNDSYAWIGHYNINRSYGTNGLNQLTSAGTTALSYDGRGNLTRSGSNIYYYTADNKLAVLESPQGNIYIGYEPSGNQILQIYNPANAVKDLRFGWEGGNISIEIDATGPNITILRRYVWGPGNDNPLVWYEGGGFTDRRFLHTDERGSVIAVTNSAGTIIALNRYDEFGIPASTNMGRFQYTGQVWLSEIGLYYYKARMYSPTLGRFMQTDPIGYADGINWYNYVGSDPINATDPTGLEEEEIVVTGRRLKIIVEGGGGTSTGNIRFSGGGTGSGGGERGGRPQNNKPSTLEKLGQCALDQIGLGEVGSAAAAVSGANVSPTRRKPSGAVPNTSPASRAASAVFGDARVPGGARLPTRTGWPRLLGGAGVNIRRTASVARIVGRGVPVVGWVLLAYDAGSIAYCTLSDE